MQPSNSKVLSTLAKLWGLMMIGLAIMSLQDTIRFAYTSTDSTGIVTNVVSQTCGQKYKKTCYWTSFAFDGMVDSLALEHALQVGQEYKITYVQNPNIRLKEGWVGKWPAQFIWDDCGIEVVMFLLGGAIFLIGIERSVAWLQQKAALEFGIISSSRPWNFLSGIFIAVVGETPKKVTVYERLKKDIPIAQLVALSMMYWTMSGNGEGSYFTLFRIVIFVTSLFIAYRAHNEDKKNWTWVALVIGIAYNPFVPFHFGLENWQYVNAGTVLFFVLSIFRFHVNAKIYTDHARQINT